MSAKEIQTDRHTECER